MEGLVFSSGANKKLSNPAIVFNKVPVKVTET